MQKLIHLTAVSLAILFTLTLLTLPAHAADATKVVNVNEAGLSQLALLPRVGPALADRIVQHRKENGKFEATEDLMLVRGIGEKTFDLLEPYVTLEGKTTLTEKVRLSEAQQLQEQRNADG